MNPKISISYQPDGVYIIEPKGMHLREIGGLKLYTPQVSEEVNLRMLLERQLRRSVKPGEYTGQDANKIIQGMFYDAQAELRRLLPRLASRSFFEFLVYMHSQWGRLMIKAQQRSLDEKDAEIYWKDGPTERRTLRYMLEECLRLTLPEESTASKDEQYLSLTGRVYVAARYLIVLSNISDQLHFFYPEQAVLTILPPKQGKYFEYKLSLRDQAVFNRFEAIKLEYHTSSGEELEDFSTVWNLMKEQLNEPFQKEIGIGFDRAFGICQGLKEFTSPAKDSFDVRFIEEQGLFTAISENYSLAEQSVRRVMSGLTLTKESLEAENRQVYDTKRHFQARFRPFARLPHPSGPHLSWDTYTLEQALLEIIGHMSFSRLPSEWRLPLITEELQRVVQILSKRFALQVRDRFERCGWRCISGMEGLVDVNGVFHGITPGEIDVVAVSPDGNTVAQVECKRLSPSTDTRSYRDDVSDFYGPGLFVEKARRKHEWLKDNLSTLVSHLHRSAKIRASETATIRPLFLTLFPNFAETKATEILVLTAKVFFQRLTRDPSFWPDTTPERN